MVENSQETELEKLRQEILQLRSLLAAQGQAQETIQTRELINTRRERDEQVSLFNAISSIVDFIYVFDKAGRFTNVNQALLDLWQIKREDALGKTFFALDYPQELATRLHQQIQTVYDSGQPVHDETPYTSPAGTTGYYEYIFVPVLDKDGRVEAVAGSTRDISKRYQDQTEKAELLKLLQTERERLAGIFMQAPAFIAVVRGPEHIFELANVHFCQLIGIDRDILNKPVREVLPEIEGQGFFEILDDVYRTGKPFIGKNMPLMLHMGPGEALQERYLDFIYQPLKEADGSVSGIVAHGVDLTERMRAEEALRESQARQTLLLELMQAQRETGDANRIMALASEALGRSLQANRVGFFEMADNDTLAFRISWTDGVLPPLSGTFPALGIGVRYLAEVRAGRTLGIADASSDPLTQGSLFSEIGTRALIGAPIIRGGRWHAGLYVNHGTVRLWSDDEIALVRAVADQTWDAIERARAEAALRESEERFRGLADNIAQFAWIADGSGWIFWYNRRWFEYTGTSHEEMQGWGWKAVHHPDHLAHVVEKFTRHVAAGEAWEDTFPLRGADGHYRWFLSRAFPTRDEAGNVVRWFGTNTDITEQRQAEQTLQERQAQIETLNARLRRAMTETHHRVKNNLQLITALIEMRKQSGQEMVSISELADLGQCIQVLGVIHDILTREAKVDGNASFISVKGVLEQFLPLLEPNLGARRLISRLDDVSLPSNQATSVALIVNELVSNAVKHGRGAVELTLQVQGNNIRLEVCDDGPGFAQGFDPFVAAHTGLELIENITRYDLHGQTAYETRPEGGGRVALTFSVLARAGRLP